MIHTVTLSPCNAGNHSTLIEGKYFDNKTKQTIILTLPYGVAIDRPLTSNEKTWSQWFRPERPSVTITWDDEVDAQKATAKFVDYLKKHQFVQCEGNYNAVPNPQFKLVDSRQVHINRANRLKQAYSIGTMIVNMSEEEMVEVSFLMGGNPVRKTREELICELCDMNVGLCIVNADKFIGEWKAPDKSHVIYAKKAISLDIIKLDNGVYKINNASIGAKLDDVIVYLKTNLDTYNNYIKKEVDKADFSLIEAPKVKEVLNIRKDGAEKAQNVADNKAKKVAEEDERNALIAELKALGVKGSQVAGQWSTEVIKRKINEAKSLQTA